MNNKFIHLINGHEKFNVSINLFVKEIGIRKEMLLCILVDKEQFFVRFLEVVLNSRTFWQGQAEQKYILNQKTSRKSTSHTTQCFKHFLYTKLSIIFILKAMNRTVNSFTSPEYFFLY